MGVVGVVMRLGSSNWDVMSQDEDEELRGSGRNVKTHQRKTTDLELTMCVQKFDFLSRVDKILALVWIVHR